MHLSRREEPFRYQFAEPLNGWFQLNKVNGKKVDSKQGLMKVLDLSWNGAKISTPYDFRIALNQIELTLHVRIASVELAIPGVVVYQFYSGSEYVCGVNFGPDPELRAQITEELKLYTKSMSKEKEQKQ